jgi:hypothetical protein
MKLKDYVKRFRKSKDQLSRGEILANYIEDSMKYLHHTITATGSDPIAVIQKVDSISNKFCGRSISGEYYLCKGWFRSILVTVSDHPLTEALYKRLGWDYDKALNPKYDAIRTVERIALNSNGTIIEVPLLLEPKSDFPIGSVYQNRRSKTKWSVIGEVDSIIGFVECESEKGKIQMLNINILRRNYERVV